MKPVFDASYMTFFLVLLSMTLIASFGHLLYKSNLKREKFLWVYFGNSKEGKGFLV